MRRRARAFTVAGWSTLGIVLALFAAPERLATPADAALRGPESLDRRATAELPPVPPDGADLLATDDERHPGTPTDHGDGAAGAAPPAQVGLALARGSGAHAARSGAAAAARIPAPPRAPPHAG